MRQPGRVARPVSTTLASQPMATQSATTAKPEMITPRYSPMLPFHSFSAE